MCFHVTFHRDAHDQTRGGHLRVTCGSVCNQDQMESSDQCGSWFRDQDELWATYISWSTQILGRCGNAFVHWSLAKSSGQKLWKETSDQGRFSPSKILDPGCKCFYGQYVNDYPLSGFWTWVQVQQRFMLHDAHVMLHHMDAKCTANLTADDGLTWQVLYVQCHYLLHVVFEKWVLWLCSSWLPPPSFHLLVHHGGQHSWDVVELCQLNENTVMWDSCDVCCKTLTAYWTTTTSLF